MKYLYSFQNLHLELVWVRVRVTRKGYIILNKNIFVLKQFYHISINLLQLYIENIAIFVFLYHALCILILVFCYFSVGVWFACDCSEIFKMKLIYLCRVVEVQISFLSFQIAFFKTFFFFPFAHIYFIKIAQSLQFIMCKTIIWGWSLMCLWLPAFDVPYAW